MIPDAMLLAMDWKQVLVLSLMIFGSIHSAIRIAVFLIKYWME